MSRKRLDDFNSDAPLTFMAEGIALVFDTAALAIFSLAIATYLFMKNYRAESLLLLATMGADALIVCDC